MVRQLAAALCIFMRTGFSRSGNKPLYVPEESMRFNRNRETQFLEGQTQAETGF
jgi:hypothetical protein